MRAALGRHTPPTVTSLPPHRELYKATTKKVSHGAAAVTTRPTRPTCPPVHRIPYATAAPAAVRRHRCHARASHLASSGQLNVLLRRRRRRPAALAAAAAAAGCCSPTPCLLLGGIVPRGAPHLNAGATTLLLVRVCRGQQPHHTAWVGISTSTVGRHQHQHQHRPAAAASPPPAAAAAGLVVNPACPA